MQGNFSFLSYNVSALNASDEVSSASLVKYFYITDGAGPSRYASLASYLPAELAGLQSANCSTAARELSLLLFFLLPSVVAYFECSNVS